MLNSDFDPYDTIQELLYEVRLLNARIHQAEKFIKDMAKQNVHMADFVNKQGQELVNLMREVKLLKENK